jgi:putative DNA primase/helicase
MSRPDTPEGHDPHALTVLRAQNSRTGAPEVMTKTYSISASRMVTMRPYNDRVTFFAVERKRAENIEELAQHLRELSRDPYAAVIRDAPLPGINWKRTDRLANAQAERLAKPAEGNRPEVKHKPARPATFAPAPCYIVPGDLDGLKIPSHMSVTANPAEVVGWITDMLVDAIPELEGVGLVFNLSSSAGLTDLHEAAQALGADAPADWSGVVRPGGTRFYFMSDVPLVGEQLKRWAQAVNARWGGKLLDPSLYDAVHLDFTGAPVFEQGLHDPLAGRRVHVVKGTPTATLLIPEKTAAVSRAGRGDFGAFGAGTAGVGFEARLEAIGGEGFHKQINTAIGAYIAANYPNIDAEWLIKAIQDRVAACEPGGRTQAQMAAYGDYRQLLGRVETFTRNEQAKREAQAAAQAQPIAPTYPDHGVTLAEAEAEAKAAVACFVDMMRGGEAPEHMLRVTVGAGKTHAAIAALPDLLEAGRIGQGIRDWAARIAKRTEKARKQNEAELADRIINVRVLGREWTPPERKPEKYGPPRPPKAGKGAVYFLTARHDLADEIEARILAETGKRPARWRGTEQPDPEQPGQTMCQDLDLLAEARRADVEASAVCKVCALRDQCGYQRQREPKGNKVIGPRELLFLTKPTGLPSAAAVLVDEGFTDIGYEGEDGKKRLAVSALDEDRTPGLSDKHRSELLSYRGRMKALLEKHEDGQLLRLALEAEGFGTETAKRWAKLEWMTKHDVDFGEETLSRATVLDALEEYRDTGFSRRRARLATMLRDFLAGDDARAVGLTLAKADLGNGQGTGRVVELAWRKDIAEWAADKPKLLLDATTAPELVKVWCPKLEVTDIEVSAPHQHVTQVFDKEFGKTWFKTKSNVRAIADLILVELARTDGQVLVILQQVAEDSVRAMLLARFNGAMPDRLHLAHHGNLTGIDRWRDVASIIVVGRPAVDRLTGERLAEIIKGGAVARVADADNAWWPQAEAGLRMADGQGQRVETSRHPDRLVEACRWTIAEGNVIQAIGRPRGVRRGEANPVRVLLVGNMPLPLTVAEAVTWDSIKPSRVEVAIAEAAMAGQALPLAKADLAAARPDLWGTAAQAEHDLRGVKRETLIYPLYKRSALYSARYWKPGTFRPSLALVPAAGGRAELERVLGVKLMRFEWIEPPPAVEPARARPTAKPEPMLGPAGAVVTVLGDDPPFDPILAPPPPRQRDLLLLRLLTSAPDTAAGADPPQDAAPGGVLDARDRPRLFQFWPPLRGDGLDEVRIAHWRGDLREAPMADSAPHPQPPGPVRTVMET